MVSSSDGLPMLRLHGLKLSYFTGKLEAYLRCKGIAYDFIEMDTADFRRCAKATGIAQMPQVERADGTWLTDTTAIIARYEAEHPAPALRPSSPAARFISLLLEDFFDEWLWRPALYYRWAFEDDARLMSAQLARTMLADVPAPFGLRRRLILARQRRVYLSGDGVTAANRAAIEALYLNVVAALEPVFAARPFLLGDRPCEADFGLFGPFFRHFSSDPTPAAILRERGPNILAWTARLWATTPASLAAAPEIDAVPSDLGAILRMATGDYLSYLAANARAVHGGEMRVRLAANGAAFEVPANPYRAHGLAALQRAFQALDAASMAAAVAAMGGRPDILCEPPQDLSQPSESKRPLDRQWSKR